MTTQRGHYIKITTAEIELISKAKNAGDYLAKHREVFRNSNRSDSSIKAIYANRNKLVKPAANTDTKQSKVSSKAKQPIVKKNRVGAGERGVAVEKEELVLNEPLPPKPMKYSAEEKRLAVTCPTFAIFQKRYHEEFPDSDRTTESMYALFGKRYIWKNDYRITVKQAAPVQTFRQQANGGTPAKDEKDILTLVIELKQEMILMKNILSDTLTVQRESLEIQKNKFEYVQTLTKKK